MPPLRPTSQRLLTRALRAAAQHLAEHPKIDERSLQALPEPIQRLMGDVTRPSGSPLSRAEILGLLERRLRAALTEDASLHGGNAVALEEGLERWESRSALSLRLGSHVDAGGLQSYEEALRRAQRVFARARPTVASQVDVLEALGRACSRAKDEAQPEASVLAGALSVRQGEVRRCIERALHEVRSAHAEEPQDEALAAEHLAVVDAALTLCRALDPDDTLLPTLREERRRLLVAGTRHVRIEPFFERFLERQDAAHDIGRAKTITMRFPSDESDPGQGALDGVMVTMKFPSDAEDGGDDAPVVLGGSPPVTMRFPSDIDDGSVDHTRGGVMVTMKFPSDHEDGGVDAPGGPVVFGAPMNTSAADADLALGQETPVARLSKQLADALWQGPVEVERLIAAERELLTRVRLTQPALQERHAWLRALEAMAGGGPAVTESLAALRAADSAPSGGTAPPLAARELERGLLERLDGALRRGLLGAASELAGRTPLTEAEGLAAKVLLAAWQGGAAIEARLEQLHHLIPLSTSNPVEVARLERERELSQTFLGGGAALERLAARLRQDDSVAGSPAQAHEDATLSGRAVDEVMQALDRTRRFLAETASP